jgi:hypothetical protein
VVLGVEPHSPRKWAGGPDQVWKLIEEMNTMKEIGLIKKRKKKALSLKNPRDKIQPKRIGKNKYL